MDQRRAQLFARLDQRRAERAQQKQEANANRASALPTLDGQTRTDFLADFHQQIAQGQKATSHDDADSGHVPKLCTQLRQRLTTVWDGLPAYDQRTCLNALNQLEAQTTQLRHGNRFVFRRPAPRPAVEASSPGADAELAVQTSAKDETRDTAIDLSTKEYVLEQMTGRTIVVASTELESGTDVRLSHLTECTIEIHQPLGAVRLDHVRHTRLSLGPVHGSIFVDECEHLDLYAITRQLRVHHTNATRLYIRTLSVPILEHCHEIGLGSYTLSYEGLADQLKQMGMDSTPNRATHLLDFQWPRTDVPSPNWYKLDESTPAPPV